jgi:hypothetical protein
MADVVGVDWSCPACTYINETEHPACAMCGGVTRASTQTHQQHRHYTGPPLAGQAREASGTEARAGGQARCLVVILPLLPSAVQPPLRELDCITADTETSSSHLSRLTPSWFVLQARTRNVLRRF